MARKPIQRRKTVRLEDVARMADISAGTASMALAGSPRVKEATRVRVMEACRALNYQPPASTRQRATSQRQSAQPRALARTPRVGLLCIGSNTAHPPYSYMIHELTKLTHRRQARLEVASIELAAPEELLDQVLAFAAPCDALLLTGVISTRLMRLLHQAGVAVGTMDLPEKDDPDHAGQACPGVIFGTDDHAMAMQATQVLYDQGHRRIAFFSTTLNPGQSHHRLYEGHCLGLLNNGLTPDRKLLGLVNQQPEAVRQRVRQLAELVEPPTAAVVLDMVLARPLLYELHAAKLQINAADMILWGPPAIAKLCGLSGCWVMGIDFVQWVQAALSFATSDPAVRLPSGSHVMVPFRIDRPAV